MSRRTTLTDMLISLLGLIALIPVAFVILVYLLIEVGKNLIKTGKAWR